MLRDAYHLTVALKKKKKSTEKSWHCILVNRLTGALQPTGILQLSTLQDTEIINNPYMPGESAMTARMCRPASATLPWKMSNECK